MSSFNWKCPGHDTTITDSFYDTWAQRQTLINSKLGGSVSVRHSFIVCPNIKCKEFTFTAELHKIEFPPNRQQRLILMHRWALLPESRAKVFPDYIPNAIRTDYIEACRICELSPKAAATLARRCLQGMIRDFWKIKKRNLKQEIDALKVKLDQKLYSAIDGLRQVGNIGAHMEKEVNLIIDVEPNESKMLIGLIELLFTEWYVGRHEREESLAAIIALRAAKKTARSEPSATAEINPLLPQPQLPQVDEQGTAPSS